MKVRVIALCLTATALFAQRSGGGGGGHYGRMVNPGGGSAGRLIYPGNGAPVAPRAVGALGLPVVTPPPVVPHPLGHGGAVIVPYPVFYGGGYYGYDAPPAPNAGGYYYDPATDTRQDSPVVIINQNYTPDTINPSFQDYTDAPIPPPSTMRRHDNTSLPYGDGVTQAPLPNDQPSVYLIALKNQTILAAIGYWMEADVLNYITQDNVHKRISLDQVDRAFTKQLNDERHIELRLPPE